MFKVWKGPEMEGTDVGTPTLFICSDVEVPSKRIIRLLLENSDVRRVYFGAGKCQFHGVSNWQEVYDFCFVRSIDLIIETQVQTLEEFIEKYDTLITTFIVSRYDAPFTYNSLQFKLDDNKYVTIYNPTARTSLQTLKSNNLFTCDIMLVEEE